MRLAASILRLATGLALAVSLGGAAVAAPVLPTADELMNWAERTYPQYFPGPKSTQTLAPYLFRHYPETGNYVGLVGSAIYLLGPVAGGTAQPVYVGELASFSCQVLAPRPCVAPPARQARLVASTNGSHVLAVKADGSVWAWGVQSGGQFGDDSGRDTSNTPRQVAPPGTASGVAAGTAHSSYLKANGEVWSSGGNDRGVLGLGRADGRTTAWARAVVIDDVRRLASGDSAQVAVRGDGSVWRWGENLGGGNLDAVTQSRRLGGFSDVVDLAMTRFAAFLARADGTVWFWGRESSLGLSGGAIRSGINSGEAPLQVPGIEGVVALAAGRDHVLALKGDGTVWSWGSNNAFQLGYSGVFSAVPRLVPGVVGAVAVAAGGQHSIALHGDGTVTTWGGSSEVRCQGSTSTQPLPSQVAGVTDAVDVAGAGHSGTFILRRDGSVWACGINSTHMLGLGSADARAHTPTQVPGLKLE